MLFSSSPRRPATQRTTWDVRARHRATLAGVSLCALLGLLMARGAQAQTTPEALPSTTTTSATLRFVTVVNAPPALRSLLERHLNIQRFQALPDLDEPELRRLVSQLPADARGLLGTQGHFSPTITARLLPPTPATPPSANAPAPAWTVEVDVAPGPTSRVGQVLVAFAHPPAEALDRQRRVREQWALPSGEAFTQAAWDEAKAAALRTLTVDGFPKAQLVGSLADVDTETHQVNLAVEIDPGPAFTLGPIEIEGLSRYQPQWVENLVRAAGALPGSPYRLQDLQNAQQRLAQSGYFDSVFVYVDPDTPPSAAPIRVQVREATRGRLQLGVGISTDNGPRLSAEHVWNRVPGLDWRALSKLKLERDDRLLQTELRSPVDASGWLWSAGLKAERVHYSLSTTTSQQLRLGKAHEGDSLNRGYFIQYDRALTDNAELRAAGPLQAQQSISVNYLWSRAAFDTMPLPSRGHGLAAELGVGTTLGQQRDPYLRTRVRWQGLLPLDGLWELVPRLSSLGAPPLPSAVAQPAPELGRLSLRAEAGAIVSTPLAPVPDSQRFWAGGDQSVRGYGPRELGVTQSDGSVRPGRVMAIGSLEWQRPLLSDGKPSAWESTVFVDAGAVADSVAKLRAKVGVGAGVRYNSPAGPLQLDLAYGLDTQRFRIHLSVGFAF
ncbi:MAG: outer membrane protein assembly factor [Polaromonas sp.]|nr:outer membrane protein assembly factor [Polaromonas sp.]